MRNPLSARGIFIFLSLSNALPLQPSQGLAIVEIQRTLDTFSLAVDAHDFSLLSSVFSTDATANFGGSSGELNGLANISTALQTALKGQKSQHALSTQVVDFSSPSQANATSYLQGRFFGQGNLTGQIYTTYGR